MDSCLKIADLKGLAAAAEGSNFVFSPLSLRAALSLTAAGARGETLRQLLSFLGSPSVEHLHSSAARFVEAVRSSDGELLLSFVNAVWVDRSLVMNPSFLEVATSIYDAVAEPVDFIGQGPLAQQKINTWIEEKTNKNIKNLIPNGSVDQSTRSILANALYFKGKWEEKFDHSMTKDDKFYLLDGSTVQVPFMSSRKKQLISTFDSFKVLRLPYKQQKQGQGNKSFSLLLFLPNEKNGLHDLVQRATTDSNFFEEHTPYGKVAVSNFMVPKFKISFDFEATPLLRSMGLKNIFKWDDADLSGMCLEASRSGRLVVSNIYHKASIEVDEEGTTASAATLITVSLTCYTPPVNFTVDHPFLFVVREDTTGVILFLGHVMNPLAD